MPVRRFNFKFAFIVFIMVLLFIPQLFILDVVRERVNWRDQVYQSMAQSWPTEQTLAGPLLIQPYKILVKTKEIIKDDNGRERESIREEMVSRMMVLIPKKLRIQSQLDSSMRYRGIYEVPVYGNHLKVAGEFNSQSLLDFLAENKNEKITLDTPYLSVLVRDQRGIARPPALQWNGSALAFQPANNLVESASAGMHVKVPALDAKQASAVTFAFDLELNGMRSMNFALLSEDSEVKLASNWASPSFTGELLPAERTISEKGFDATWRASSFSFNVNSAVRQCEERAECLALMERAVGFSLMQPVDVYQQSERSVKYAVLFIVLTFGMLLLFELLKKLRIHPVQYTLVGVALLVFYLLLISLSEHVSFVSAYGIAVLASTGLLSVYFSAILRNRKHGMVLGIGLALLYGLLYAILQSEDNALLMGSMLIFVVLAALMLGTRHFDWYALMSQPSTTQPKVVDAVEKA